MPASALSEIVVKLRRGPVGADPLVGILRSVAQGTVNGQAATRTTLAQALSLSPATVSKAVTDLREVGLVAESVSRDQFGRSLKQLRLDNSHFATISTHVIDHDGEATRVVAALCTLDGRVLAQDQHDLRGQDPVATTRQLANLIDRLASGAGTAGRTILGVAVQVGGHVREGVVIRSANMKWDGFALADALRAHVGVPVAVENDVTALTIGDHLQTSRSVQWPTRAIIGVFDEGVGGGLVIGGRLHRGTHGLASEFGHTRVNYEVDAPACRCLQRGCVESYLTSEAIARSMRESENPGEIYWRAGQMLGRAIVLMTHLADIGHITLLLPKSHNPDYQPEAKYLQEAWDAEFNSLYSREARPDIDVEWHDPGTLTERHAAAGSATILQDLLRRMLAPI